MAAYLAERMNLHMWPIKARVRLAMSAQEALRGRAAHYGTIEAVDEHTCVLLCAGADMVATACYLAMLDVDMEVEEPAELREAMAHLGGRLSRAAKEDRALGN
ncbi:Transcriptional regulator, DeoR family [Nocardiopsis sp. JB363]|nr:Transcriptional regulator, DeoR family [Nocardiopsis sp. JB363]